MLDAPTPDAQALALARQAATDGSVWLFSSGEAVGYLQTLLPAQDWQHTLAVATHPRIALALEKAGFVRVRTVRPTVQSVVEAVSAA